MRWRCPRQSEIIHNIDNERHILIASAYGRMAPPVWVGLLYE